MSHVHLLHMNEEHKTVRHKMLQAVAGAGSRWSAAHVATLEMVLLTFLNVVLLENMLLNLVSIKVSRKY